MKKHPLIYAFWLEGSDALDTVDEYSDMDIWIDAQDGYEAKVFQIAQLALSQIADVDLNMKLTTLTRKSDKHFFILPELRIFSLLICASRVTVVNFGLLQE